MFQRKLIVVLGLVALVVITAGVSQASLSRVEGMNLGVPELSQFTDDYTNLFYYPSSVVRQNNFVLAEVGNNPDGDVNSVAFDNQSFTVVRNFPRFGSVAFQMKGSALNSTQPNNLNHEQLDMIWGKAFTKIDLAVRVDITNSKFERTVTATGAPTEITRYLGDSFHFFGTAPGSLTPGAIPNNGVELNTYGITPAITIHMQNDNRIEGAVTYRKYTLDRSTAIAAPADTSTWQDNGNSSYAVLARGVFAQGDKHVWYPAAWYLKDDLSSTITHLAGRFTQTADETYKAYGVGISDNMKVNENNLLLWGVTVSQVKAEYASTLAGTSNTLVSKISNFPLVFAAIETDATKWLKVRFGASRALVATNDETTTSTTIPVAATTTTVTKTRGSDFHFGMGTGIRWNNLDIDMTLNQAFPLSGGYILSGDQATPFTRVSATYHF